MASSGENAVREGTKREAIDEMLRKAHGLAQENDEAALRLRGILLGSSPEKGEQAHPARPGWFGEMAERLEAAIEHLENTAKALKEISQQVDTPTPTV